ncbi:receptor-like protein 9a [Tripterygium wilfordii]|uniref:receptor-like protein 9a n=1 Tax=Tripterygium wilfordii TaxID=458696 RepID=UPI0018F7FFD4|nr:receptor-like protein 9a [Tripterygium wilfordii]
MKSMEHLKCWRGVVVTMLVLLHGLGWSTDGCVDQEREALLQLKLFFYYLNWPESSNSSDCCEWERVVCNATTGRVTKLSLVDAAWDEMSWYLNASYFLPFEQLTSLDLSGNYILGCVENQGFEILWLRLRKLEILDLSWNNFDDSIISSLSGFSSLNSLYLSVNGMGRTLNSNGLESLWRLSNLELLDLSYNQFNNSMMSSLRGLSSLKVLYLGWNQLSGIIDMEDLINLANLNTLEMIGNEITGFRSFKGDLEFLDLTRNRFNNNVFASLNGLSRLKFLNLSQNQLTGSIHLKELACLRNLEELQLNGNKIEEIVGPQDKTTLNKLKVLGLAYLQPNGKGVVLKSLGGLSTLKKIDLRENILNETNAFQDLFNLSRLEELFLDHSSLHKDFLRGHVGSSTSLKVLHLSSCGLKGTLPDRGWCDLKNLEDLNLSDNELEGALPPCMANLSSIHILDLSHNQLTGNIASTPIPNFKSIESLSLGYNHFQVSLKPFANHSSLKTFQANDGNELIDQAASHPWTPKFQLEVLKLSNCITKNSNASFLNFLYHQFNLRYLDLSSSKFGGAFPSWLFDNNTRLQQIYLMDNSFLGPFQLPSHPNLKVYVIDISHNKLGVRFSSNISFVFPNLVLLNISKNSFQGTIPPNLGDIKSLEFLDLSNNQLSGEIKDQFSNTPLQLIRLSNNNFSGFIPNLFDPVSLSFLLLDGNNFVGELSDLSSLMGLVSLDISRNSLSGRVP